MQTTALPQPEPIIPPLGYHCLTPLYDPLHRWLLRDAALRAALLAAAGRATSKRVLDLGCGTATLTLLAQQRAPQAFVAGLDADRAVLRIAQRKARFRGACLPLQQGRAQHLPYADAAFDCVLSCLMLHHLTPTAKHAALAEAMRVLRPGGMLLLLDFAPPQTRLARSLGRVIQRVEYTADALQGSICAILHALGMTEVAVGERFWLGTLALYQARKPPGRARNRRESD